MIQTRERDRKKQLTGSIVDIEERREWISFRNETVSYLPWISFITVFGVHMKDLHKML